jgi:thymidine phosphorylase
MPDHTTVLHAKRDGQNLDAGQIRSFVEGITSDVVTDAQLGAFSMAVCLNGMSMQEQVELTLAMRDSGEVMQWPELNGPVLDKHSTGGVGDMVSLILAPLLVACGAYVPMISGRGLGHTGGTLDKLESIPGFQAQPDLETFRQVVRQAGAAIIGQTDQLAPADRRVYATRDTTSTVPSVPLIVSSILSKKLTEGLDGLVLDIKTGNGAFMREYSEALDLATQLATVSAGAGLPCCAMITDMNQPLAWSAGNTLEVREAIQFLSGRRHPRLEEVTLALCNAALLKGGLADDAAAAQRQLESALDSGAAAECFSRMVAAQGGPTDLSESLEHYFPPAPVRRPVLTEQTGTVCHIDTRAVGLVVMYLGGGRQHMTDKIDPRVGLTGLCSLGAGLERGMPLAEIHAANEADWERAARSLRNAITLGQGPVDIPPCVYQQIDES